MDGQAVFAWDDGGGRVRAVPSVVGSCRPVRAQLAVRVRSVSTGADFSGPRQ